jgi:RimJ/RimL family protein N-acetyltransferase
MGQRPPGRIDADGLLIRRWRADDITMRLAAVTASSDHLRRWLPWACEPQGREDQEAYQRQSDLSWESGEAFSYGIFSAGNELLLGGVGLHARIGPGALEIGYWAHIDHTGRGIVSRAVAAVTEAALDVDDVQHVEIRCDESNTGSAAIPRRLGYQLARTESRTPRTPDETGHWMIWIMTRAQFGVQARSMPGQP